ncbi:hypothetical protein FACS1894162_4970 [Bacteroidia bacterium]|nr:hypothetical protein FACS1894162_4970 [Bacteroidia bacterium]
MKIYNISLIALIALLFAACEKETDNLSSLTDYVAFHIEGDNPLIVQVGNAFTDPGCVATLQGKNVTSTMKIESNVDADAMGMYKIEYSAVNADGLTSRAVRDVIVCNPSVTTDLSGTYTTQAGTHRLTIASGAIIAYPDFHSTITYLAPGFFSINDFLGGYYAERVYPQYGYSVMGMTGYFALNEDNTIDLISSYIDAWGDGLDKLENGAYDPATGEISWDAFYAGSMKFHVILKK